MSTNDAPSLPIPFWRRALAGLFDFVMVFFGVGYVIGKLTGESTPDGFSLHGGSALVLFAIIALYFYLGWKVLGGTVGQRVFRAR